MRGNFKVANYKLQNQYSYIVYGMVLTDWEWIQGKIVLFNYLVIIVSRKD